MVREMDDLVLVKLGAARTALAEAKTIQETKNVLDIAISAEVYARRQKLGEEAIEFARSIKVEALRQLGGMLKRTPRNTGAAGRGKAKAKRGTLGVPRIDEPETLAEIGLDKKTSKMAQDVAEFTEEEVEKVKTGKTTISQVVRRYNRKKKMVKIVQENLVLGKQDKVYSIIYADPPWKYEYSFSESRAIENQYPTMELEDIMSLPVRDLVAEHSIIFLWCPPAFNEKAFQVLRAWGFEYRTQMVWVKPSIGPGQWVRQQHELLLIGVKGNIPTPEGTDRPSSVIEAPRRKHSEKPQIVYDLIEKMYPTLERIELFARQKREKWDAWGNQV